MTYEKIYKYSYRYDMRSCIFQLSQESESNITVNLGLEFDFNIQV